MVFQAKIQAKTFLLNCHPGCRLSVVFQVIAPSVQKYTHPESSLSFFDFLHVHVCIHQMLGAAELDSV